MCLPVFIHFGILQCCKLQFMLSITSPRLYDAIVWQTVFHYNSLSFPNSFISKMKSWAESTGNLFFRKSFKDVRIVGSSFVIYMLHTKIHHGGHELISLFLFFSAFFPSYLSQFKMCPHQMIAFQNASNSLKFRFLGWMIRSDEDELTLTSHTEWDPIYNNVELFQLTHSVLHFICVCIQWFFVHK